MKSTKAQVLRWLSGKIQRDQIDLKEGLKPEDLYYFTVEGFCKDSPIFFLCKQEDGLHVGYQTFITNANGQPVESRNVKQLILWTVLENLERKERQDIILDALITTIRSRKKQYKTCQYCSSKFPPELRFSPNTCKSCADSQPLSTL